MFSGTRQLAAWAARLGLAGLLAAACWLVAPALSAEPYLPLPEQFQQRLSAVAANHAPAARRARPGPHRVTHRSAVLVAPARFDLAGIAGETRHYEMRAREAGEPWSEWVEVAAGDPAWFGGADLLQVRTRGWRPRGRIHYVNVSGDATPTDEALTRAREAVAGVTSAVARVFGGDAAEAIPSRPPIVTRAEWGAERRRGGCEPRREPDRGSVRAAVVHHTVSANSYSRAEAPGMVLGICLFHRNGNGWDDIGYNALVDRFGTLYEGRDGGLRRAIVGAHTQGYNAQTFGLAALGTHTKVRMNRATMRASARMLAWKLARHGKTAAGRTRLVSAGGEANRYPAGKRVRTKKVIGHRRLGLTECPGTAAHRQIERLRRMTQRRIAASGSKKDGGSGGTGGMRAP